ncbi:eukaryotic initiation factor 3 gamma subunit family protein [Actinidia rufa]|uniref:tRNA (adenine(58)-N(1))-methyltransferase non-catalytic subunit TRM6 n=1 Tax=Actinidia rufa TaxID=165716 RepID=A0A7J0EJW7_9ERIC|nr:eukaryotic initiation factor 3 gamma subunit family protein [Actinidia rufa]
MSQNKNLEEDANQNPRVTWEGCSVLLDVNDGDRLVFARLTPASTLAIGNKKCALQPLIGCPFGSLFQVENGKEGPYLSRVLPTTTEVSGDNVQEKVYCQIKDESKDNRALVDNNTAQSLTGEDIDSMRRQGATGDEIVQALIANSATFEKKTSFSQEKYRLKKQKKYAPKVLLRRPFTRRYLRVDTLALLLSMGNVSPHSDVLVVDMVGGILTGAVAERLGGTGFVCNTYLGVTPYPIDIVRMFNFSSETCRRIVRCSLTDLCSSHNGTSVQICQTEEEEKSPLCSISMDETVLSSEKGMLDLVPETSIFPATKACKSTKAGEKASQETINLWKENGFSSLIIAAPDVDAWRIVKELLPFLSFSAPFAIYHQYIQDYSLPPNKCTFSMVADYLLGQLGLIPGFSTKLSLHYAHLISRALLSLGNLGLSNFNFLLFDGILQGHWLFLQVELLKWELIDSRFFKIWLRSCSLPPCFQSIEVGSLFCSLGSKPLATCMHNLQLGKMAVGLQISEPWLREYQKSPCNIGQRALCGLGRVSCMQPYPWLKLKTPGIWPINLEVMGSNQRADTFWI